MKQGSASNSLATFTWTPFFNLIDKFKHSVYINANESDRVDVPVYVSQASSWI